MGVAGTFSAVIVLLDAFLGGECVGIIEGILFARSAGSETSCLPNGVIIDQGVIVVVQYIDARPARLHESFKLLVFEALQAAWPCKR